MAGSGPLVVRENKQSRLTNVRASLELSGYGANYDAIGIRIE